MFVSNSEKYFKTESFPKFIGSKIGCPFNISSDGRYLFLKGKLLDEAIIKSPFYVKVYIFFRNLFGKTSKK